MNITNTNNHNNNRSGFSKSRNRKAKVFKYNQVRKKKNLPKTIKSSNLIFTSI